MPKSLAPLPLLLLWLLAATATGCSSCRDGGAGGGAAAATSAEAERDAVIGECPHPVLGSYQVTASPEPDVASTCPGALRPDDTFVVEYGETRASIAFRPRDPGVCEASLQGCTLHAICRDGYRAPDGEFHANQSTYALTFSADGLRGIGAFELMNPRTGLGECVRPMVFVGHRPAAP